MPRPEIRRCRVTIGQVMIGIAVCAVGLASPMLFVFGASLVFWWLVILNVIYHQTFRRVAEWFTVAVIIALLYALCQPAVSSRGRRPIAPGSLVTRPTASAASR